MACGARLHTLTEYTDIEYIIIGYLLLLLQVTKYQNGEYSLIGRVRTMSCDCRRDNERQ